MKEKIKEINDYFVNKLVNGEYTILSADQFTVTVLIDTYRFDVWVANGPNHVSTNDGIPKSFMDLHLTNEEKHIIYSNLYDYSSEVRTKEKLESYNKLKEELGL
jgi:hypothetical protein